MKLIVITQPDTVRDEAAAIDLLFRHGLDILHLRKPRATELEVAQLLRQIPQQWHERIMLHDFDLTARFRLMGLHLNSRRPMPPCGYDGRLSVACHSIAEAATWRNEAGNTPAGRRVDYLFLSPIYDSISKPGYCGAYSVAELQQAAADGIIDERVVAMGGITTERIPEVARYGFGGVALLGDVWRRVADVDAFVRHFDHVRALTAGL